MNFLSLQSKVIEKLKERSTPVYWPLSEIKDNINRGCRKLAADTAARLASIPLDVCDSAEGTFYLPANILEMREMKWNGRKLHRVSAEYLDANNGQNSDAPIVRGEDATEVADWRAEKADSPQQWLLDDGLVRLYPIPNALAAVAAVRTKQEATLSAGSSVVTFSGPLPLSQNLIDLYIQGVWQNSDQWAVTSSTQITVVGTLPIDAECEVVFFPTAAAAASTKTFKYILAGAVGQTSFVTPRPYRMSSSALSVKVSGVSQAPSAVTETSTRAFTLAALPSAAEIEITILESRTAYDLVMRASFMPADMSADTDTPDLPQGMEYYHDALWMWALAECYSRDGQTKRIDLSEFYSARYFALVDEYKRAFGSSPVLMQPRDAWRI